jgi:2-polyprenyl-3-methyl-5-hydroxy-6-metoxy-1,4-benzoquinol methylase
MTTGPVPPGDAEPPVTAGEDYAQRLTTLAGARWKRVLNVQAPYRAHLRSLRLGRTLDVGCGIGRNLHGLPRGSVGVDHNPHSVRVAREAGLEAYTVEEFFGRPDLARPQGFDSILVAHVVEHMPPAEADAVVAAYLPLVPPGARVVFITPQERGHASDATHVAFTDFAALTAMAGRLGLRPTRRYSFPLPRVAGRVFPYNEFVLVATKPS